MSWLTELVLVAGPRRYGPEVLLYEGIVPDGQVRLEGRVDDADLQQVQVEHFAGSELAQIKVVPVRRGRFFCHLDLFRGANDVVIGAFDASGRVQARRIIHRTRLREWGEVMLVAFSLALIMRAFLVQAFAIPSDSMRPTLRTHDQIFVDKLAYQLGEPARGDLVVFDVAGHRDAYVKRVVGLPGEVVTMRAGRADVGGRALDEPYATVPPLDPGLVVEAQRFEVPEGHLFVLGDNRMNSKDSRDWGAISRARVIGRAALRFWPPSRVGVPR